MSKDNDLLIVTGLSGAGMSSSLKALEDMGYEVFDNFPPSLVGPLVDDQLTDKRPIAVGIDTRTRAFSPDTVLQLVEDRKAHLLFLDADETILQQRFTETRRRHPLAEDRPVIAGIRKEREWLYPLKGRADRLIDTTELSIHDLRRTLEGHYSDKSAEKMAITLMSFGFRYGIPREADLVMDVRFVKNPHWDEKLRPLTGKDKAVGDYIEKDEHYIAFIENYKNMITPLLPRYAHEGKSYLTIAIGCTGGRHRSVYSVEKLTSWLSEQGYTLSVIHRDLDR